VERNDIDLLIKAMFVVFFKDCSNHLWKAMARRHWKVFFITYSFILLITSFCH